MLDSLPRNVSLEGMDAFSLKRLQKFVGEHREKTGELATIQDIERAGFSSDDIAFAEKKKAIESFYVTLTNGVIKKAYKVKSE